MVVETIIHDLMHAITALLAGVLFILSLVTYLRNKKKKFLFICSAFFVFGIKEILLVIITIGETGGLSSFFIHFLNLVTLTLFALGVLK
jgi:hypothetical protein